MELIGLYLIAGVVLVAAGIAKVARPDSTARALASIAGLPFPTMRAAVRIGALIEALIGVVAIVVPRPATAGLVALSYLLFAAFVAVARTRGGAIASCGCFGTPDTPATMTHVVVNVVLAVAAAAVALDAPTGTILAVLAHQPGAGVPLVVTSALGAWLTYLAIAVLASLQAARGLTAISFRRGSEDDIPAANPA